MNAASYSAPDMLRDGTPVEIRALQPGDRDALEQSMARMSKDSIVRRFFAPRSGLTEQEIERFVNVDFSGHVALVALVRDAIVGGARYVVLAPGAAEMACAVEDAFQGRGLGKVLLRHLGVIARAGGIREIVADVLADNQPMLGLLRSSGLPIASAREPGTVRLTLSLGDARPGPLPSLKKTAP